MSDSYRIFDRRLLPLRRARASGKTADYLMRAAREALAERLTQLEGPFDPALLIGRGLDAAIFPKPRPKVKTLTLGEHEIVDAAGGPFGAVVSNLELHWVNDLPGVLIQVRRALKPGGLFLACLFGGETLRELRRALLAAEEEAEGRVTPRVAPFADVRDAGDLLQRAGFAAPVADLEALTVSYADLFRLMRDLRAMGEANLMTERKKSFTRRRTLERAAEIYAGRYADAEGRIPATFQLLFLTGRAPGMKARPKPAESREKAALKARFSMKRPRAEG